MYQQVVLHIMVHLQEFIDKNWLKNGNKKKKIKIIF